MDQTQIKRAAAATVVKDRDPADTWRCLMNEHKRRLRFTSGCGERGQIYVDESLKKLKDFAKLHPEYQAQVPSSEPVQDDGYSGMWSAILAMGAGVNYNQ